MKNEDLLHGLSEGPDIPFDLPLVLGASDAAGIEEATVVFGELTVGAVKSGLLEIGLDDTGLEVIEHDSLRHAAELVEHPDV